MKTFGFVFAIAASGVASLAACGTEDGNPIVAGPDGGPNGSSGSAGSSGGASGSSGGTSGSSGSSSGGASGSSGTSGSSGASSGSTGTPALVVSSKLGLHVYAAPQSIGADVAPDVTVATTPVKALGTSGNDLFVGRESPAAILRFQNVRQLTAASTPLATAPRPTAVATIVSGGAWFFTAAGLGNVEGWKVAAFGDAATPTATFTHPSMQIPGFAYDPSGDRLFGSQISGAGTLAWNAATTKTAATPYDFQVAPGAYWTMTIAKDRLYAAGAHDKDAAGVAIWDLVSTVTGPKAPVLVSSGIARKFISHVVVANDLLVLAARDEQKVYVWKDASKITADQPPTFTIPVTIPLTQPMRLAVDPRNRLYVTSTDGVTVWRDIGSNPTFVTTLHTGLDTPADVVLVD